MKEKYKKQWARPSCGNVGKVGNNGYKDLRYRLCNEETESLEHILEYIKRVEIIRENEAEWVKNGGRRESSRSAKEKAVHRSVSLHKEIRRVPFLLR